MLVARNERIAGAALLIVGIFLMIEVSRPKYAASTVDLGADPGFFPTILLTIWLVLAAIMILFPPSATSDDRVVVNWRRAGVFLACIFVYFATLWLVGFLWATMAFLTLCPIAMKYRPVWASLLFGVTASLTIWWLFARVFRIVFPEPFLIFF